MFATRIEPVAWVFVTKTHTNFGSFSIKVATANVISARQVLSRGHLNFQWHIALAAPVILYQAAHIRLTAARNHVLLCLMAT